MAAAPADDPALGDGTFDNAVALVAADARYDVGPFMFRGVVANVSIADADQINTAFGGQVGSRIAGGYVEGAYNLLRTLGPRHRAAAQRLHPARALQHPGRRARRRGPATTRSPGGSPHSASSYKPVYNVIFKGDYQIRRNKAGAGEDEQLSLGVGYQF